MILRPPIMSQGEKLRTLATPHSYGPSMGVDLYVGKKKMGDSCMKSSEFIGCDSFQLSP